MTLSSIRRVEKRYDPLLTETIVVSVGPQHPSLVSPVQLHIQADGELIERVTVEQGFMHRGIEMLCSQRDWAGCAALLSRTEWLAGMNGHFLLSSAIEELSGLEVPQRAQFLRSLVLELGRLSSHLYWFGDLGLEVGAVTPVFWAMREREPLLELLDMLSGHRWHGAYIVPGGVSHEPPAAFYQRLRAWLPLMRRRINSYEEYFSDNAIWVNRSELIGVLETDYAIKNGASGPVARASAVDCDLRRDAPYAAYGELSFKVPLGEYGDALDRFRVRFMEMRESMNMVEQCLDALAGAELGSARLVGASLDSPSLAAGIQGKAGQDPPLQNQAGQDPPIQIPAGEAFVSVEGPRGELALSVVSDGGHGPARVHLRGPSMYHLHLLDELCRGYLLADLFVIYASLDIMVGEADR
ncbi:NADH-quinone oxidoreductase subunit D [bacterium]|nr:NADH-quinone oxidoreductase subunit D [bacterium]